MAAHMRVPKHDINLLFFLELSFLIPLSLLSFLILPCCRPPNSLIFLDARIITRAIDILFLDLVSHSLIPFPFYFPSTT
ncbi:hypothetical protein F4818DRAFT_3936 [Hypoxylon cercidicola]|nr:hypothetical protein F4818DRAFT_3936 [Hypoxylon cercidicola]